MTKAERSVILWAEKHKYGLFMIAAAVLGLLARYMGRDHITVDYTGWLAHWYETLSEGGFAAIAGNTGCDYNVLYQVLIVIMSFFPGPDLYKYKILSIIADFAMAFAAGMLACDLCGGKNTQKGKTAFSVVWSLFILWPTFFLNSGYWAQCDSIYVSLILFALVFHFREKPLPTFLFLSFAFAFKLQTVLIFPFFLYEYVIRKKYSILWFLLIPVVNAVICVLCGTGPLHFIDIYLHQTDAYQEMTSSFPNLWILIYLPDIFKGPAIIMTITAMGYGLLRLMEHPQFLENGEDRLKVMIWTIWTCLMFLPHMHDRYGYLLSALLLIWVILDRKAWIPALLLEVATLYCYRYCLFFDLADDGMKSVSFYPFVLGWIWTTWQLFRSVAAAGDTGRLRA